MERITISLDEELASAFDALIAERGYRNRSEAVRDLLRRELEAARQRSEADGQCVATLSYLYNHHQRELAERLTGLQHGHHDLTVSTLHAHLDHDHCIECVILRGPSARVRRFAESIMAESGVRHGCLNLISVEVDTAVQPHGHAPAHPHTADHKHYRPRS
ncbi:MAG TPA: nickel-responsive transcriptional regulator NikR [Pseudothauera hydrothermalis]|jgi:CopG family nickel-responsive transcriptional regulator|nr:nickel-responsive transcriptional regulator NikR [Zoogloeaceae bacteirum Par-f-2]HNQ75839.1 nickel-responsive transcriptional regulator NikR [Pseudothauera hydrothermalis]